MNLKTLPLLLLMSIFWIGDLAQAQDIEIQTPNVRVSKDEDGDVSVNTRNQRLRVPAPRSYVNLNSPRSYRHIYGCKRSNLTRQEITQITRSGRTVINTHLSNNQCY
ncbi:hypothetical protein [Gloeothece verrucosa]|uniref:Uncharacterized protein n=1 Tax=Gloeothece verrucosa (strain PCC 7822) TaxID=497965 RepID=E0UK85_GLOV7|nr:hypothetical protein [Gloeothece verrucosa]ADN15847.1 hypothetical protein Cyan7822_3917 [Gloeothece verrucosa PCC 7822]